MYLLKEFQQPIEYGYFSGVVSVKELSLLDSSQMERLLDVPDFTEKVKVLADTEFSGIIANVTGEKSIEEGFDGYQKDLFDDLLRTGLKREVIDFFRIKYDFLNLSYAAMEFLFDKKPAGQNYVAMFSPKDYKLWLAGEVSTQSLSFGIFQNEMEQMREKILLEELENTEAVGSLIREWQWKITKIIVKKLKNKFIEKLLYRIIDIANIKAFSRIRHLGLNGDFGFIAGGRLEKDIFKTMVELNDAALIKTLKYSGYDKLAKKIYTENFELEVLDREASRFLLDVIDEVKYIPYGVEKIIRYLFLLESEITFIKTVLLGSLNNIKKIEIFKTN